MRRVFFVSLWLVILAALSMLQMDVVRPAFAQEPFSTPTYDPLDEPPLPPDPTEFELGRHLYWLWCMTCHGDRGQGLTDDWRARWEIDHQNCWARGCHTGRSNDQGFPIPTVVPLIIGDDYLAQFATLQDLVDFLKITHPPQHPGILKDEEYHAIAAYVFTLNDRSLVAGTPTPMLTPTLAPSSTLSPAPSSLLLTRAPGPWLIIILVVFVLIVLVGLLYLGKP